MKLLAGYPINFPKAANLVVVLTLMHVYDAFESTTAWIYLSMHGSYGIIWAMKGHFFPDRYMLQEIKSWLALLVLIFVCGYWVIPWIIISQGVELQPWRLGACVMTYCFGLFFHFVSDMQKYIVLSTERRLIQEGLWKRCRNKTILENFLYMDHFVQCQ